MHTGPLIWEERVKRRIRDKIPKDYYYQETMGKIKASPLRKNLSLDMGSDSEINDTIGDYSTQDQTNHKRNKTIDITKKYDFQKPPYHKNLEKNTDILLKSTYEDNEDS